MKGLTMEYLLYALPKNEIRSYMEELIASNCKNESDLEKVKEVAISHGFHSFRVAHFNWEAPNFSDPKLFNI